MAFNEGWGSVSIGPMIVAFGTSAGENNDIGNSIKPVTTILLYLLGLDGFISLSRLRLLPAKMNAHRAPVQGRPLVRASRWAGVWPV
jgi:hypothetical protein